MIGYDASMALPRFLPESGLDGELSLAEQSYLQTLVQHAGQGRKVPVLTCTRSLGRMAAVKKAMHVQNVLLYRNIFDQWASYTGQYMRGNPYFMSTIDTTLQACRHDVFLSGLDQFFPGRTATPQDEGTFTVFVLMHLYLYAHAIDAADLLIDTTALATDAGLRHATERELSHIVHGPIDLSDAHDGFEASLVTVRDRTVFVDTIEQFMKLITSTCHSERAVAFVTRLKDETLAQWDRHDRLTRRSVSWHLAEMEALKRQFEPPAAAPAEHEAAIATLTAEKATLVQDLAQAAAARTAVEGTLSAMTRERDELAAKVAEEAAARASVEASVPALASERDDLAARLTALTALRTRAEGSAAAWRRECEELAGRLVMTLDARAATEEKVLVLTGERDGLATQLADALAARAAAEEKVLVLTGERDGLATQLADALAARAASEEKVLVLTGERDGLATQLADALAARAAAETSAAALLGERDGLMARLAEAEAARAAGETVAVAPGSGDPANEAATAEDLADQQADESATLVSGGD